MTILYTLHTILTRHNIIYDFKKGLKNKQHNTTTTTYATPSHNEPQSSHAKAAPDPSGTNPTREIESRKICVAPVGSSHSLSLSRCQTVAPSSFGVSVFGSVAGRQEILLPSFGLPQSSDTQYILQTHQIG